MALMLAATVFALFLAELIVRAFSLDSRFISKVLYYQSANLESHQADPDPRILYRLKSGWHVYWAKRAYEVNINSLGVRGPERSPQKPAGAFRIIAVGGSNVYGAEVSDNQTWPAQLESVLNRDAPGTFEVWNLGTSAYVPVQMSAIAAEAVERYGPNLVIYAFSNQGARPFLWGTPVKPYFDRDPSLWRGFFTEDCLSFPSSLSYDAKFNFASVSALYRCLLVRGRLQCRSWMKGRTHESINIKAFREFVGWARGRVKLCVFFYPGASASEYRQYTNGLDVPVLDLKADGKGKEYLSNHPPPHVLTWYAERMAPWLREKGLIPQTVSASEPGNESGR